MTVDCHTHIFESGHGGPFDLPASAGDLVREMDVHHVDLSIVLPLPGVATNEFVHQQCALFPERLVGLYTPEFERPAETLTKMETFFQHYHPCGLKIHPRWQRVTVNDSVVREALAWAGEHNLPVLFDLFPHGEELDNPLLHPLAYHRLAQEMPNLRMILAHSGGYKVIETFLVAKSNPNVFLDISFTPLYFRGSSVASDLAFVCQRIPVGRILYGSDFPNIRFGDSLQAAYNLTADLNDAAKATLFGGAALELFRLARSYQQRS